ncbi:hypothetical protein SORBI_3008G033700 [Sorghum bicolor]|uniref:ABC transporter domain-containing protein n=1 Tax=Sorghum bicolor TaxID=4558 RepID=A0A1Z5R4R1_SORBI|nr:hypothetical protein SORBI_3008G033700 [Sorghum bicolor]
MDHQDAGDGEERQQQLDDREDEQDHVLLSPPEEDGNQEPLEIDKESVVQQQQQQQQLPLSLSSSWRAAAVSFRESLSRSVSFSLNNEQEKDDEVELRWAAVERLPTMDRLHTSLQLHAEEQQVVDVRRLGAAERRMVVDTLIANIHRDNLRLLRKQRQRMDRVGVRPPTVEVRWRDVQVEADCQVVHGKPLPTIWNTIVSNLSLVSTMVGLNNGQQARVRILHGVSGVVKPSRLTLLLGPPGCGKTTLLKALAGKLNATGLKVTGEVEYNGVELSSFVPEKTAAYIDQYDLHVPEMTVRETIDFSARFQGVGNRAEIMKEVIRKEKEAGITPDPDVDTYMKAISVEGLERSMQTDYIMKIMGLDVCADIMVGDAMRRGISGGEKKRLTTGEMIVGPSKALFMDEISTGLDSSTTFQIVSSLQQLAHISESTILVSLLQPAPETYELFDDIILMAEGKIVYHGSKSCIMSFFESCGFKCPDRKGSADFLQEVLSEKDQQQYWSRGGEAYNFFTIDQFCDKFKVSQIGQNLDGEISKPYDKSKGHKNALSYSIYSLSKWELLKACFARELLLMKRNAFIYITKIVQLALLAAIVGTVFLRTHMGVDRVLGNYYMGSLFFALLLLMVNGFPELSMAVIRLPVFYKQRDYYFYPAWAYAIPAFVLKVPISLVESIAWTSLSYFLIGYTPEASRFLYHLLILFLIHTGALSMFRCVASYCQTMVASVVGGTTILVPILLFGGFLIPRPSMPNWLKWGFWLSPLSYAEIGLTKNEFLAPRWTKLMLMKRGGQLIYAGPLGHHSCMLIQYFQAVPGVPKIKDNYNPSTWMLEVTSTSVEAQLGVDFAQVYKESSMYKNDEQGLFNILGCMFGTTIFVGINNCQSVMPFVSIERSVVYRERFAGMYSPWAYSFAQVIMEIPYVLVQIVFFMLVAYPMIGYALEAAKFFWLIYTMFCTLLYFVYFGMMMVSLTPNIQVASILTSLFYTIQNLMSGYTVPGPKIPKWWLWLYYTSPMSWTLNLFFTTQFGYEDHKKIEVFGETKSVAAFLRDYFGFRRELLPITAVVLVAFPIFFATLFGYSISKLNFQRR